MDFLKINFAEYSYCKQYSAFSLYPKFNDLCIVYDSCVSLSSLELKAVFSVIDNEFIITVSKAEKLL